MSQTSTSFKQQKYDAHVAKAATKFEVALIPVTDVDRAKEFYARLGWRLDDDFVVGSDFRAVQFTPPGFRLLHLVRKGSYDGCARLVPGRADRVRH
jgi:catechol 2,3-dioxygenase-like lactoylglutathione lyase family enzyme